MAEELGLGQGFGERRGVEGHERTLGARAILMDELGRLGLAGAVLALHQDGHRIGVSKDPLKGTKDPLHGRAGADDALKGVARVTLSLSVRFSRLSEPMR